MTQPNKRRLLLLSFLISAVFMGICSKSSPLYPMNDWVDVNCFFTVGKSILQGVVPYRDLYEQKGPLLYFLYAIAALISRHSFFGVYLLDTVSFGLFLYCCGRIAQLYLGNRPAVYAVCLFLAAVIPTSPAFCHGSSVESVSLWMLMYPLYVLVLASREKRTLKTMEAMCIGLCAAGALYMKFTMVGFFLGLCVHVAGWYLLREKKPLELLKTIGAFLGGMAALSAVIFGYFLIHGAVRDFITAYFYNNLFLYPTESPNRLLTIYSCLKRAFRLNPGFCYFAAIGWLWFIFSRVKDGKTFSAVTLSLFGLAAGTYWGGRSYPYYGLVFAVYSVFGPIGLIETLDRLKISELYRKIIRSKAFISWIFMGILAVALPVVSWRNSGNVYLMSYQKQDMPQYQFAQIINTVEDATVLNYGFLDGGFYFASDTVPSCRFFCTLNIPISEMWDEHKDAIENGEVDFIITRDSTLEEYSLDSRRYALICTAGMYLEGKVREYYLYRLTP